MKTVRVSKSMFYSLKTKRYACGKKYVYRVRGRVAVDRMIVERYPNYYYYYHDGIIPGRRLCTLDYARRNGLLDIVEVKEKQK